MCIALFGSSQVALEIRMLQGEEQIFFYACSAYGLTLNILVEIQVRATSGQFISGLRS